jgi:ADP-L-glycero-D-manno-heptose 6-epimerase
MGSINVFNACVEHKIKKIILSETSAMYEDSQKLPHIETDWDPKTIYATSKACLHLLAESYRKTKGLCYTGLRYFNVYGPREQHKCDMASVVWHANGQILRDGKIKLFSGCDGYGDGEQLRDFVFVEDVVNVNLWFWQKQGKSGIYNVGTGKAESFNAMTKAILNWHGRGEIEYIPFPEKLRGRYQSFTQADLTALRAVGCDVSFRDVAAGVKSYLSILS